MSSTRATAVRRKHLILIGVISTVILGGALWASHVAETRQKELAPAPQPVTKPVGLGLGDQTASASNAALQAELEGLRSQVRALGEKQATLDEKGQDYNAALARGRQPDGAINPWGGSRSAVPPPPEPTPTPTPPTAPNPLAAVATSLGAPPPPQPFSIAGTPAALGASAPSPIRSVDIPASALPVPAAAAAPVLTGDEALAQNRAMGQTASTYVTAGTFCRAVVLVGMEAPTGGQAQSNPVPAQFELIDDCKMPNGRIAPLRGCFLTGNGYGELSAERAYIRTDRLTCIDDDNAATDIAVRGYAVGEDGKPGLRGEIVTKQGQAIANSIWAAVASGTGRALVASGTAQTVNPLTGATTSTVTDGFKAGVGDGLGKGFDRISEYYLKLADKLYPTVSVSSMRVVDIAFQQGFVFERKSSPDKP